MVPSTMLASKLTQQRLPSQRFSPAVSPKLPSFSFLQTHPCLFCMPSLAIAPPRPWSSLLSPLFLCLSHSLLFLIYLMAKFGLLISFPALDSSRCPGYRLPPTYHLKNLPLHRPYRRAACLHFEHLVGLQYITELMFYI